MSGMIPTGWYLAYEDGSHGVHETDDPKAIYRERLYRLDDADDLLADGRRGAREGRPRPEHRPYRWAEPGAGISSARPGCADVEGRAMILSPGQSAPRERTP